MTMGRKQSLGTAIERLGKVIKCLRGRAVTSAGNHGTSTKQLSDANPPSSVHIAEEEAVCGFVARHARGRNF